MRRSLALFSGPEASVHTQSLAGFIMVTCGFKFSVHTEGSFWRMVKSITTMRLFPQSKLSRAIRDAVAKKLFDWKCAAGP